MPVAWLFLNQIIGSKGLFAANNLINLRKTKSCYSQKPAY
jgi:hypothetical protein